MLENKFFRIIKHLLPKSRAFKLTPIQKILTKFFKGFIDLFIEIKNYYDLIWLDIFPKTTRVLSDHENDFGIVPPITDDATRIATLESLWSTNGGQSPSYIQSVLQAAGFNVYVHEVIPTVDPATYLADQFITVAGEPNAIAGEPNAVAGKTGGEVLVNGEIVTSTPQYQYNAGDSGAIAGEPNVVAGEIIGTIFTPITYPLPTDPDRWPYFWYVGGAVFPNNATVDAAREIEFKSLILKVKPTQTWVGLLITFA